MQLKKKLNDIHSLVRYPENTTRSTNGYSLQQEAAYHLLHDVNIHPRTCTSNKNLNF